MRKGNRKDRFISFRGVLIRTTEAGIHPIPHCPTCQLPMYPSLKSTDLVGCSTCGQLAEMTIVEFDQALAELQNEQG